MEWRTARAVQASASTHHSRCTFRLSARGSSLARQPFLHAKQDVKPTPACMARHTRRLVGKCWLKAVLVLAVQLPSCLHASAAAAVPWPSAAPAGAPHACCCATACVQAEAPCLCGWCNGGIGHAGAPRLLLTTVDALLLVALCDATASLLLLLLLLSYAAEAAVRRGCCHGILLLLHCV